jgi:hypothetical protein
LGHLPGTARAWREIIAMMFGYGGMGGGWPVWAAALMWIGMLAFLGVLIWIGYTLMTRQHQQRRGDRERRR